jgi:hypothetical protein
MSRYRTVHTGQDTQPGGAKAGFATVEYHVLTVSAATREPIRPADRLIPQTRKSRIMLLIVTLALPL